MKNYYHILGIDHNATLDVIKKAHKKLSLKFHPDVNGDDDFFTERFKEAQEAYETLRDPIKRKLYDDKLNNASRSQGSSDSYNFSPSIEFFRTTKAEFEYDDEVVFSWKTINANKVVIKPFGEVQPIGQKTFKLKNFKKPHLDFELIAENTNINRKANQILTLKNNTYKELYYMFKGIIEQEEKIKNENSSNKRNEKKYTETVYRKTTDGNTLQINSRNKKTIGANVLINGKQAADGVYIYASLTHKLIVKNGEIVQHYFLEVKDNIIYETIKDSIPNVGDKVYDLNWNKAKDGKYKYSFWTWYNVKNGVIVT
jgi:curved DNA-binding protein CbpA